MLGLSNLIIIYQGYKFMLCMNYVFIELAIPNLSLEYVFVYHKSIIKPVIKTDFEHKIPFGISDVSQILYCCQKLV